MKTNNFNDRDVDKASLKKTKSHMWSYIRSQVNMEGGESKAESPFGLFFRRMALSAGAMAVVVLLAFGAFILKDSVSFLAPKTVYADFQMEANDRDSTGVESDSTFTLRASDEVDKDYIEENLEISPEGEFSVENKGNNEFEIIPEEELNPNTVYRFTIKTGDRDFSWAYQVKDEFKIASTLPGDHGNSVPTNSGIEINFSHENFDFEKAKEYFSISPAVSGKFEQHNKTLSFIPNKALAEATIYTVTVKAGLPVKKSDQKLAKDHVFQFETGTESDYSAYYEGVRFSNIAYETSKNRTLATSIMADYDFEQNSEGKAVPVKFYRFNSEKDYLRQLQSRFTIPNWSYYYASTFKYDKSGTEEIGLIDGIYSKSQNYKTFLYFPQSSIKDGYYLMEIENEKNISQALLQVSDISLYSTVSKTNSLFWVNNVATKSAVNQANIEIMELGVNGKTNDKGVLQIETPEEFKKVDGEYFTLKITKDDKVLYTMIHPEYGTWRSAEYWRVFFTDRPVYLTHDTVNYSGFISPRENTEPIKDLTLKWTYGNSILKTFKIKPDGGSHFNGKLDLNGISPGWYNLELFDGDLVLGNTTFEVRDYTKPAYDIVVTPEREAVFRGEDIIIDIKAQFFDGTPVPNTELVYSNSGGVENQIKTDLMGNAKIKLPTKKSDCVEYCGVAEYQYFEISPKFAEEADIRSSQDFRIFSKVALKVNGKEKDGKGIVEISSFDVDLTEINSNPDAEYDSYYGKSISGQNVDMVVKEVSWIKIPNGSYYDFINKVSVPKYDYKRSENTISNPSVTTDKDGNASYSFDMAEGKFYEIEVKTKDKDGNIVGESVSVIGPNSKYQTYEYYQIKLDQEHEKDYRHIYKNGDTVGAHVEGAENGEMPKNAVYLFTTYNNGLNRFEVSEKNDYKFRFDKKDVPETTVEGVFFDGVQYNRVFGATAEYDEELQKLNVEVKADKKEYNPGDKVKLSLKVTDQKNRPISTTLNLNLVDEAYFKMIYDYFLDPLEELYGYSETGKISESYSHESPMASMDTGGKGGCFLEGTKILMADGSYKDIEKIKVGDKVLTKRDFFSMQMISAEVKGTVQHSVSEYLLVNGKIKITPVHIVWLNNSWMPISEAKVGDVLLDKDHQEVKITSIERIVAPVEVYNFEVENQHTYFADDIYVHNDKGGSGVRNIFEDTAIYRDLKTDGSGEAEIEFTLPHNITSWRVMARAVDMETLSAGHKIENIQVSLPFFVDLIMNREYSVMDKPIVKYRSFGTALKGTDEVKFSAKSSTLNFENKDLLAKAFSGGYMEIPKLSLGSHKISLSGAFSKFKDTIEESISVKSNKLKKTVIDYKPIADKSTNVTAKDDGLTTVTLIDRGLANYFGGLVGLVDIHGNRVDQAIARQVAVELLEEYFEQPYSTPEFISNIFQSEGIKLLPYGEPDLYLSALTVAMDPAIDRFNKEQLSAYFMGKFQDTDANLSEIVYALTGLASLSEPVLTSLELIKDNEKLTVTEKLFLALAFAKIGDIPSAEEIWEVNKGNLSDKDYEQNALASVLAAMLQDKDAEMLRHKYISKLKDDEYPLLYEIGYVNNILKSIDKSDPVIKLNGKKISLKDKRIESLALQKGESVNVEVVSGEVTAVVISEKLTDIKDFKDSEGLDISRIYNVYGNKGKDMTEGDLVEINLKLDIDQGWKNRAFEVVDILPSGLTPVSRVNGFNMILDEPKSVYPWQISGKEVRFLVHANWWGNLGLPDSITYYARVVNPGEFYADPARIQMIGSDTASISEANTITIKKAE